jgi:hypothetical protein
MSEDYDAGLTTSKLELYSSMEGVDGIAALINAEFNRLVRQAIDREQVGSHVIGRRIRDKMYEFCEQFASFGACDTEPSWAIVDALREAGWPDMER